MFSDLFLNIMRVLNDMRILASYACGDHDRLHLINTDGGQSPWPGLVSHRHLHNGGHPQLSGDHRPLLIGACRPNELVHGWQ